MNMDNRSNINAYNGKYVIDKNGADSIDGVNVVQETTAQSSSISISGSPALLPAQEMGTTKSPPMEPKTVLENLCIFKV